MQTSVSQSLLNFYKPLRIYLTTHATNTIPLVIVSTKRKSYTSQSMAPATLPTRPLGRNGPPVTALGFGAMGLSAFYGSTASDEERFKVLDRAYELGETNWDSADIYGDNEDLIGKWFARTGKRKEVRPIYLTALGVLPVHATSCWAFCTCLRKISIHYESEN